MWSEYFFYLMGLQENERNSQIMIMVLFWICSLIIGIIAENIKKNKVKAQQN